MFNGGWCNGSTSGFGPENWGSTPCPPAIYNVLMEARLKELTLKISQIENRNKKVEQDKIWETSKTRKFSIAIFTYLSISFYFFAIELDRPFITAVVPTLGFLLSTLSLPWIRKIWERNKKHQQEK